MPRAGIGPDGKYTDDVVRRDHSRPLGKSWPRVTTLTPCWLLAFFAVGVSLAHQASTPNVSPARSIRFVNNNGPVKAIAFQADGRLVLATRGNVWRIVEEGSDNESPELKGSRLAFSPDGALLALGEESMVTIRDVASAEIKVEFPSRTGTTLALAFSPDSGTLAIAGDRGISIRNFGSGCECAGMPQGPAGVTSLAFSSDGGILAMGDRRGYVQVWDLPGRRSRGGFRAHAYSVTSLELSPDGRTLVSTSPMDTVARLWDAATFRPVALLRGHPAPVQAAAFAPSGRALATASREGVVRLWDAATGCLLAVLPGNDNGVSALAFSRDGRTLVAGGVGGLIWSWDVAGASNY